MISKETYTAGKETGFTDENSQSEHLLYPSSISKNMQTGSNDSNEKKTEMSNKFSDVSEPDSVGAKAKVSVHAKLSETIKGLDGAKKDSQEGSDTWSQNQQVILEWALRQYPKGTDQRWEKIAEHIPGKNKVSVKRERDVHNLSD